MKGNLLVATLNEIVEGVVEGGPPAVGQVEQD